jgi:hypothetical protein
MRPSSWLRLNQDLHYGDEKALENVLFWEFRLLGRIYLVTEDRVVEVLIDMLGKCLVRLLTVTPHVSINTHAKIGGGEITYPTSIEDICSSCIFLAHLTT